MSRRQSRKNAMQLIYEMNINEDYNKSRIEDFCNYQKIDKNDEHFFKELVNNFLDNFDSIVNIVKVNAKQWNFDRINKLDLSIIELGVCEILYSENTPDSVAINEAVELSKEFSTEKSYSFINGILGSVVKRKDDASL
ncbi:transcription antitermination factor NusB [uncultured Finegoldia sp.]|uniref:transcription antitermination factor NusB n=1 Tax=uncultured Finegoldia sp. TaxID=328009 RepID=UPI0026334919|nr:transcription antitermination factor NusB [uncultured Finegoldia sp.]